MGKRYLVIDDTIINLREVNYINKYSNGGYSIEIVFKNGTSRAIYFIDETERNWEFDKICEELGG